jgi:hypothetical protein
MDTEFLEQQFFPTSVIIESLGCSCCTGIHDGQILNHRGTMDTEFLEQQFFSDLYDHRVSGV